MNNTFYSKIEHNFTKSRLAVYRQDGVDDTSALARYLYNMGLCKTLYTVLNVFEITLRNKIDEALCSFAGKDDWYDVLPLDNSSKAKVTEAKNKITKKGKTATHDRIIAELTLGFWTSLLTTRYSQAKFQSHIIKNCLSKCPAKLRSIKSLQNIFDKIRILRNRVSHYERIIHWKDLLSQHEQLIECIKWLDEESFNLVAEIDMFEYIYSASVKPFIVLVKKKWNK